MTVRLRLATIVVALVSLTITSRAAQQTGTFRATTDTVLVPVSVLDGTKPVTGLTSADFELLDDGQAQQVRVSALESLPIDVTLVLDVSASVSGRSLAQFTAELQRIAGSLPATDRVRVLAFGTRVKQIGEWQPGGATFTTGRLEDVGGLTAFYDALATAFLSPGAPDRPHLIFAFSDGGDNLSFTAPKRVTQLARRSDAALYLSIAQQLAGPAGVMAPYWGVVDNQTFEDIVDATGGLFNAVAPNRPATIPGLFSDALKNFRMRYVLSYSPQGVKGDGWHEITVRVKNRKYTIRGRQGYDR